MLKEVSNGKAAWQKTLSSNSLLLSPPFPPQCESSPGPLQASTGIAYSLFSSANFLGYIRLPMPTF